MWGMKQMELTAQNTFQGGIMNIFENDLVSRLVGLKLLLFPRIFTLKNKDKLPGN